MSELAVAAGGTGPWLAGLAALAVLLLAAALLRRAGAPEATRLEALADRIETLAEGQHRLAGALAQVAEAQVAAQGRLAEALGARLERTESRMGVALAGHAARTGETLGALARRLEAVDRAQVRMERLAGEVGALRALLSNRHARGLYGEIQLMEIVARALPPDAYRFQAVLSNGRRPDCLILLPGPPGPIAVDAKFPLEAYEALVGAGDAAAERRARTALRSALTGHLRAVAERYLIPGETAEAALLFLPSEAVYAELHAHFADVVRNGFEARVWIVSPTTLMAVLTAVRGVLRDARLAREGASIRRELGALGQDLARLGAAATGLERHLGRAGDELARLRRAAAEAGRRATRLERLDFAAGSAAGDDRPVPRPASGSAAAQAVAAKVSAPATGENPSNSGGPR